MNPAASVLTRPRALATKPAADAPVTLKTQ
jgi:hypothetical protein